MERAEADPYLTRGIIAYIGNKRRLLSLIGDAVRQAAGGDTAGLRFADLFSGSGIVSRFARRVGMKVTANDWEPYAGVLGRAWLEAVPGDIPRLFGASDGLVNAVEAMNRLPEPGENFRYLSRYYAPASGDPDEADYRTERLFYTRQNALRLDAARNHLERMYPDAGGEGGPAERDVQLRRSLLLAPILYAAATHVNTSGVFKAFHKGFGGHGGDALGRITAPIEFQPPVVIDAPPGRVFSMDAADLASGSELAGTDVAYLDPPYNQHQYGSNYHLLNTLVRWDRIPEPLDLGPDGRLLRKAGIRRDWVKTRSDYCSRRGADSAFSSLLDALDAPLVLISYSTDGIIPFQRLRDICENYGRLRICANPYVTYRGGRQSVSRRDRNLEFVLIIEKGRSSRRTDRRAMEMVLLSRRLQLAMNDLYRPEVILTSGDMDGDLWYPDIPGPPVAVPMRHRARLISLPDAETLGHETAGALAALLDAARCESRDDELEVIEDIWRRHPGDCRDFIRDVPRILRKMAHRKYRESFESRLISIRNLGAEYPGEYHRISERIDRIEEQARLRFSG